MKPAFFFVVFVILPIVFAIGYGKGVDSEQSRAIQAGVARYTVNPETGAVTFTYGVAEK